MRPYKRNYAERENFCQHDCTRFLVFYSYFLEILFKTVDFFDGF